MIKHSKPQASLTSDKETITIRKKPTLAPGRERINFKNLTKQHSATIKTLMGLGHRMRNLRRAKGKIISCTASSRRVLGRCLLQGIRSTPKAVHKSDIFRAKGTQRKETTTSIMLKRNNSKIQLLGTLIPD
jgi:beta-phosphoglucomutase-like phosphatase (HAD superfamily)